MFTMFEPALPEATAEEEALSSDGEASAAAPPRSSRKRTRSSDHTREEEPPPPPMRRRTAPPVRRGRPRNVDLPSTKEEQDELEEARRLRKLKRNRRSAEKSRAKKAQERAELEARVKTLEEQVVRLTAERDGVPEGTRPSPALSEEATEEQIRTKIQATISEYRRKTKKLTSIIAVVRTRIRERDAQIEEQRERISGLTEERVSLEDQIEEQIERISSLSEERDSMQAQIARLISKNTALQAAFQSLIGLIPEELKPPLMRPETAPEAMSIEEARLADAAAAGLLPEARDDSLPDSAAVPGFYSRR